MGGGNEGYHVHSAHGGLPDAARHGSRHLDADAARHFARREGLAFPSFYGKVGDGCSNPPELARLVVSCLPSLSDHLLVVRVGAPSDNELRMMRSSAISGTKARVTGDDDFVTIYYDE
jgi:hypothetical protein